MPPDPGRRADSLLKRHLVTDRAGGVDIPTGSAVPQRPVPIPATGDPGVEVVKAADGTIQRIIVRCPCGRETSITCEYPAQGEEDA